MDEMDDPKVAVAVVAAAAAAAALTRRWKNLTVVCCDSPCVKGLAASERALEYTCFLRISPKAGVDLDSDVDVEASPAPVPAPLSMSVNRSIQVIQSCSDRCDRYKSTGLMRTEVSCKMSFARDRSCDR